MDDHASIRDMLVSILKRDLAYEVVGEAGTGLEALRLCAQLKPDMVILDLMLPELSGTEVLRRMHATLPATRVLVYSGTYSRSLIIEALKCQPHGFVEKSDTLQCLRDAISTVAAGGSYFTQCAAGYVIAAHSDGTDSSSLTEREREVLQMVAEGRSNKQISHQLGVSNKTVENHRAHLMNKLKIHDIAGLTRYAVKLGMVAVD